jgi:hypothetical protein
VLYLTTLNIRRGLYLSFLIDEDLKASLGPKTKMLVRKPIINPLPAQGETCLNAHYFPKSHLIPVIKSDGFKKI